MKGENQGARRNGGFTWRVKVMMIHCGIDGVVSMLNLWKSRCEWKNGVEEGSPWESKGANLPVYGGSFILYLVLLQALARFSIVDWLLFDNMKTPPFSMAHINHYNYWPYSHHLSLQLQLFFYLFHLPYHDCPHTRCTSLLPQCHHFSLCFR